MRSPSPCQILTQACVSIVMPSGMGCGGATMTRPGWPAWLWQRPEIVLTTRQRYEPDWLVASANEAAAAVQAAGGRVVTEAFDIPVGRLAIVADPFGNALVLLDLSNGHYVTDAEGNVTAVTR